MDAHEVNRVRATLSSCVADVFASVPRKDQRAKSDCYLRGLMTDGRRKSIQTMASRLPDGNEQNLRQFVNQSTWDPVPVRRLAAAAGRKAFTEVTWREGSRGAMASRFLSVKVRPAGVRSRRLTRTAAVAEHGRWDDVLPEVRLLAEWPDGEDKPTRFWLSDLPDATPIPDHFEGRSWNGWHHHATLVTAAHAFLTEQRPAPKADTAGSPSTRSSTPFRTC
ncbi:transposase [Streptomyces sp. NPDC055722]